MEALKTFDIKSSIVESTNELFETMLSMDVELSTSEEHPAFEGARITGSLSFAGQLMGSIAITVSDEFSKEMTASMLGMEIDEIEGEDEINDVILEVCNIIGGNLKSNFNDAGMDCVISTPSITIGMDFNIESMNMDRSEGYTFINQGNKIFIEIALKPEDKAAAIDPKRQLSSIDIQKFGTMDIISSTGDKVIEFFDAMLSMDLELVETPDQEPADTPKHVGTVNFAGDVNGSLNVKVSGQFAHVITSNMLGIPLDEIENEDDVKDVIGEMTNIIAGNLKTAFCDSGLKCVISPPSITAGKNFKISVLNMDRYERFTFKFEHHDITVEVCVKIDEAALKKSQEAAEKISSIAAADDQQKSIDALVSGDSETPSSEDQVKGSDDVSSVDDEKKLDLVLDIPVELIVELGRTKIKIKDFLALSQGSSITFSNLEGEPLDILANNKLIAKGEVVVENQKYGIRITELLSRMDRIKNLK
ncbi:MAG: flagellar motor switch protein FliN [Desulfosarcina sp.]|nr:flagellar motor switch protein FliN [Desulfobacterales bacterium]